MCGIAGFVDLEIGDRSAALNRMVSALDHRGPDGTGHFIDDRAGIGMTRLAIIDLEGGDQPKASRDGDIQTVFNGEIYNYREIRRQLQARHHSFCTESDSEVVVRAYEEWGPDAFRRLDGMFAIAIWERDAGRLTLARDRIGKKPLYVWQSGGSLAFASELKALAKIRPMSEIDEQALAEYLHLGYVPGPRSIWSGVTKVTPGCLVSFHDGRAREVRYWKPDPARVPIEVEPNEAVDQLERLLLAAVAKRLVADVEVGVLLSGGVDSSLVARAASQHAPGIHTFTVAFDDPERDESAVARRVATGLGSNHHEALVTGAEARAVIGDLPTVYDEPFADASAIPTLLISRFASEWVKVVLGGDGGDELFNGYRRYRTVENVRRAQQFVPRRLRTLGPHLARSRWPLIRRGGHALENMDDCPAAIWRNVMSVTKPPLLSRLLGRTPDLSGVTSALHDGVAGLGHGPRSADLRMYLPDDILVKVDRASMSTGLEVRAPFLDTELVDWALWLADSSLGPAGEKRLPRLLLGRRFGPEVSERRKQGFGVPLASWLAGPLRPLLDEHLSPARLRGRGMIQADTVAQVLREFRAGRQSVAPTLWALLMLEMWCDRWLTPA